MLPGVMSVCRRRRRVVLLFTTRQFAGPATAPFQLAGTCGRHSVLPPLLWSLEMPICL